MLLIQFISAILILPSAHAKPPVTRFDEAACAAALAALADEPRLYGAEAAAWVRTLPPERFNADVFDDAQGARKAFVQTVRVTGDAAVRRLDQIFDETDRLNREVAATRAERHRRLWSGARYLTLASISALVTSAGLVAGPETWPGAVGAVTGFLSTSFWLEKFFAKRRYLGAPRRRTGDVMSALHTISDVAHARRPGARYNYSFSAILSAKLVAEARHHGRLPTALVADAVDQNVLWAGELVHYARPAMEVTTFLVLTSDARGEPTLTSVTIFAPFNPEPL